MATFEERLTKLEKRFRTILGRFSNLSLSSLLTNGSSAGGAKLTDVADPTLPQDASTKAYTDSHSRSQLNLTILSDFGSNIKSEPVAANIFDLNSGSTPTTGQLRISMHYLTEAKTFTGIRWFQLTQGSYTASNYNGIALYKFDNSTHTFTLVASSATDGNIFKATSATWSSKDFTTPYVASAGYYFAVLLHNNSATVTGPTFGSFSGPNAALETVDFTNNNKLNGFFASQTSLPSSFTMTDVTASPNYFYLALY